MGRVNGSIHPRRRTSTGRRLIGRRIGEPRQPAVADVAGP